MDVRLTRFDPFAGLTRWGESLDQFFNDLSRKDAPDSKGLLAPAIDVSEDKNTLRVTAGCPDADEDDPRRQCREGLVTTAACIRVRDSF